jgi:Tfp pilus assembly PilM family ATPase
VEFLTDALSVPVELLNPFAHLCCEGSSNEIQALMKNGPVYAIATGLAMRTV